MIRDRKHYIVIILSLISITAFSQRVSSVRATARAQQKQILVRWGVTNAQAWKVSNQYGFEISRYTVLRDKAMLITPERKRLGVFKAKALNEWEKIASEDEYAAIIAQAMFGESFEVTGSDNQGILSTVNKAQEAEQRFALSLYAADHSFNAALTAGWGLVDTEVKQNEKYLYRIRALVPNAVLPIDSTAVFIGLEDYRDLPVVVDISSIFTEKSAMLSWDYEGLKDYYNSYFIERSSDGTNFYRTTEKPVSKIADDGENVKASSRMHYIDTLGMYDVTYYYRVLGVTPFGEVGPPSTVVSGVGKKLLAYVPHISRTIMEDAGNLRVEWEFESEGNSMINGFTLNQSRTEQGPYVPVLKNIERSARVITYDKLFDTNYFTLTAEAIAGESRTSMPVLVQPVDSIPPIAPVGLKIQIDSAGIARVSWSANSEKDLLGYKVFRSYSKNAELTPVTDTVFLGTSFVDTVSMRMSNRKIYYAVTALDKRFNQSQFSPKVVALKPDIIPPTSPLFTQCTLVDYVVKLAWADSKDSDIASHALYKKADTELQWKLIRRFNSATPGAYTDNDVERGHFYTYTLISKDSSSLESKPASPVSIKVVGDPANLSVTLFNAFVDRTKHYVELFWSDGLKNIEEYQLYKKKKGDPVTLWKIVKQNERRVVDEKLVVNTEYTYGIRVVTRTGEMSPMKWVVVNY